MKKMTRPAAMMSFALGLLSALPAAQAAGTQTLAVSVSAHVQSDDFNVSAIPGSVWLATGSNSRLAVSKEVSLALSDDKKSMTLEVAGAGVSNKSISLMAAQNKSLQAMVTGNTIYNTDGLAVPLTVTIDGKTLSAQNQEILPANGEKATIKTVMMDVSATSSSPFAEGDYAGTMTVVFSAGA